VAIVGAGPGMGMALARRFGRFGAPVALIARGGERLAQHVEELAAVGVAAHAFPADVGHEPSLRLALEGFAAAHGAPAVLIHNASANLPGVPSQVPPDDVLAGFRVGVLSALVALQEVAPAMTAAGRGTFLVTGGGVALTPWPGATALSIQKAGVRALALAAARELAPAGIHVATVTVAGVISAGSAFDPDKITAAFWHLHAQAPADWETEVVFRGDPPTG
jgi:NAD(P)-dependent dehydrogenase (short-subunit alcohol dehydrogenase family)